MDIYPPYLFQEVLADFIEKATLHGTCARRARFTRTALSPGRES